MNKGIGIRTADIYLRFPEIMEEEADDLAEFLEDEKILYEGATDIFMDLQKKAELLEKQNDELKRANDYHQGIIHELETMKSPNQLYGENVRLRSENERLQKLTDLGEHYKHLYSEVKKQKDDVICEIKKVLYAWEHKPNEIATLDLEEILRMLGEIDG